MIQDDKRSKKDLKKKGGKDDRYAAPRDRQTDISRLASLPPNPPSMLTRKRSLGDQQKSLELNLLQRPEIVSRMDSLW